MPPTDAKAASCQGSKARRIVPFGGDLRGEHRGQPEVKYNFFLKTTYSLSISGNTSGDKFSLNHVVFENI